MSAIKIKLASAVFAGFIVFASLLYAVPQAVSADSNAACRQAGEPSDIIEVEDGWWEDKRLIYKGIPARILVLLGHQRSGQAGSIAEKVWCEFERIGRIANAFDPTSELGVLNAQSKEGPQTVSADLAAMLRSAKKINELSGGAFDPTMWPVKLLWAEAARLRKEPGQAQIYGALAHSGFDRVQVAARGRTEVVFTDPLTQLDMGGVAKGYAVDRVSELIRQMGGKAALVQLGGEIAVFGSRGEQAWKIGVQHPFGRERLLGTIEYNGDMRVSTSGSYRQGFEIAGKKYSHIFEPRSGWPLDEALSAVTLVSPGSGGANAELDAAATAIMVLGPEKGLKLAQKLGVEALLTAGTAENIRNYKSAGLDKVFRDEEDAQP